MAAYDALEGTREEVARRFRVSLGMVKKLLQQRRKTGDLGHRHGHSGRKARMLPEYRDRLEGLVAAQPDLTLAQIKTALTMPCTVTAVHHALAALGLTYKKRRSMPPNKAVRTSSKRAGSGNPGKPGSRRSASSSSTNPPPRRT